MFSQRLLLALVQDRGLSRDEAYRIVERLAQPALDQRTPPRALLESDPGVSKEWISTPSLTTRRSSATRGRSLPASTRSPDDAASWAIGLLRCWSEW
jgi:Adenylosuccinate lyase C-terminus